MYGRHHSKRLSSGRPVLQKFSLNLYRALSRGYEEEREINGNVFVSPFGVAVAFLSALAGARNDTADQILGALGVDNEDQLLHEFDTIGRALGQLSEQHVGLANKMYLSTSLELADSFKEAIHRDFYAQVGIVNFQGDPALAVREINTWLQRVTAHKMAAIVAVSDVEFQTRVLMVSTAYLRCLWLDKFSEIQTTSMPFYTEEGENMGMVPTMCSRRICNYCHVERLSCRILELPCMLDQLRLIILLPDRQSDLAHIEKNLREDDVENLERLYTRNPLDITLPKFSLEQHISLAPFLDLVGVKDLFNRFYADLTGISDEKELCVHDFLSKSRFEVTDEDPVRLDLHVGTLRLAHRHDLPSFEVNKPFMFIVIEKHRKSILYLGCLRNPTQA